MTDDLLIVGGAGAMGRWFAAELDGEFDVSIRDADRDAAERLSREEGYGLSSPGDAGEFDAVLLAVPIRVVEDVARGVGPEMSEGSLLADVTSVKRGPVEAMRESAGEGVEVLGMHPMFGPTADSLQGQTVILTPVDGGRWFERFEDLLRGRGAHVRVSSPEEHDEMMSVIQGLTHFAYLSFGAALERLDFDVSESRGFMSPVYEVMMDFAGRILGQNPYLYAEIQMANPLNEDSRGSMVEAAEELRELCREADEDAFVERMRSAAKHFGDTSSALRKSDKLIRALVEERQRLQSSVGEEIALLNTRTGNVHVGTLERFSPEAVELSETGGSTSLKPSNVRLLPDRERDRWKAENLPLQRRDVSVVTGDHAEPGALKSVAESVDGVADAAVVDRYAGEPLDEGFESLTVHLEILHGEDAAVVEDAVREEFRDLGLKLR